MKPQLLPQRERRVAGFLSQLFFQSIKLSQPLCLGERRVAHLLETGDSGAPGDVFESVSPSPEKR